MPRGDGTGPAGMGPMTGRAAGGVVHVAVAVDIAGPDDDFRLELARH